MMASKDQTSNANTASLPLYQSLEYQRDVINDDLKKMIKLLRFTVVQNRHSKMPLDYFMELVAMEFYDPDVQTCVGILREERRRLLDIQLKLTELIALSSRPASSFSQPAQLTTPSTSASVPQQQERPRIYAENEIDERLRGISIAIRDARTSLDAISTLSPSAPVDVRKLEKAIRYAYHPDRETCWRNLWEEQDRLTKRRDALELEFEKQRSEAMSRQ